MLDPLILAAISAGAVLVVFALVHLFGSKDEEDYENAVAHNEKVLKNLEEERKKAGKQTKKPRKKHGKTEKVEEDESEKENVEEEEVEKKVKNVQPLGNANLENKEKKNGANNHQQAPKIDESPKENVPPPQPKKKSPRPVNVKDLDQKKVLARLSGVQELEEGYVTFLTSAFRDADFQKNNLGAEVKALHKKLTDSNQKVEKLQKEKAAVAEREKQEQNKQANLATKIQQLQSRDAELSKAVHTAQAALQSHDEAHAKETQQLKARAQQLDGELHALRGNNQKLVGQLKTVQNQLAAAPKATDTTAATAEIAKLNEQIRKFEVVVKEHETLLEKKTADYLAVSNDAAHMEKTIAELGEKLASVSRQLAVQLEKEATLVKSLEAEKAELLEEKAAGKQKYVELKGTVDELHADIGQFRQFKDEQAVLIAELNHRVEQRVQEIADEKANFEVKEVALRKELAAEKEKVAVFERQLAEEKARVVEIPRNEPVEEVFELSKTNTELAAAPSTSSQIEQELRAENAKLNEKNDSLQELRQRNYNLLEKTDEAAPKKKVLEERRRVVASVGKLGKKELKSVDDEAAYYSWLDETVSGAQKEISAKPAAPKAAAPAAPAPKASEGTCRQALVALVAQLEEISSLHEKREKEHREEVAQLRASAKA